MATEVFLEALQNYLNGQEWRQSVEMFVASNCKYFHNIQDMDHEQHQLWKTFQDIVETILEMALANCGGSLEMLETALDDLSKRQSKGPRDDLVKDVLDKLLSFTDFESFALMMKRACDSQSAEGGGHGNNGQSAHTVDTLMRMGFRINDIDAVINSADPNADLEDLVMELSAYVSSNGTTGAEASTTAEISKTTGGNYQYQPYSRTASMNVNLLEKVNGKSAVDGRDAKGTNSNSAGGYYVGGDGGMMYIDTGSGDDDDDNNRGIGGGVKEEMRSPILGKGGIDAALLKFADEVSVDVDENGGGGEVLVPVDVNELNAKFVIADSVLDSFDANVRSDLLGGGGASTEGTAMLRLIRWAEDMKMLYHDICVAYEEQLPCKTLCFNCPDGLIEWYKELEKTRQEVDGAAVAGTMLSDAEMHRMAELDKIAALGTADEQLLHSLISRHDELGKEIFELHRQMSLLVASERGVKRESLEQLYLYLKQQVANGLDLEDVADELHDHVYNVVSSARGGEVINILLDMHIFEDEQTMLKQRIIDKQGSAAGDALNLEAILADADGAEVGMSASDAKSGPIAADVSYTSKIADSEANEAGSAVRSNVTGADSGGTAGLFAADSKQSSNTTTTNNNSGSSGNKQVGGDGDDGGGYLAALKEKHRASVSQLKDLLQSERDKKLHALEEKLMRRRALKTQQQQKQKHSSSSTAARGAMRTVSATKLWWRSSSGASRR